jgi:hypothetical protein
MALVTGSTFASSKDSSKSFSSTVPIGHAACSGEEAQCLAGFPPGSVHLRKENRGRQFLTSF